MTTLTEPVLRQTDDGAVLLAGHDARELVARHGTPLVVMLEQRIRDACRAYRKQIEAYPRTRVYYASKALLCTGICRLMEQEGMGLDLVSSGELHTALTAAFPPDMMLMHGNAKTEQELELALRAGVGRIVIDNLDEIGRLAALTERLQVPARVFIRVTPGVKPHTHHYVATGQVDSKFGFNLEGGAAEQAVKRVLRVPRLELVGLHCHIGSQIFESRPFAIAARAMMRFYAHAQHDLGAPLDELNMGGGLGIRYQSDDCPPSVEEHLRDLRLAVLEAAQEVGVEPPLLCDEPGRSIVGRAGVTLYRVQSTKRIPGVRNYVSVDGGMTDNPRYALYDSRHQFFAAERFAADHDTLWSVSGRCCESGDMLIHDVALPGDLRPGEILVSMSTGAYTYSMASNYNRVPRPAVVLAGDGQVDLLVARESVQDLVRLDRIPHWLER